MTSSASAAGFVRAARASDAPGLARIQVESWLVSLREVVPDEVLSELGSAQVCEQFTEQWRAAITSPPSSRHRVHVATGPEPGSVAVGFASSGPATDPDKWPGTDAELYELHVRQGAAGRDQEESPPAAADGQDGEPGLPAASWSDDAGHGARLLHAVADTLAEDGFHTVCTWALSGDSPRLSFLESAGWAPDGVQSNLDMGVKVPVVRLHIRLSELPA